MWPTIPSIKRLRLHIVSIHINLYQNRFINECARNKEAGIPSGHYNKVFCECRRTYGLHRKVIRFQFQQDGNEVCGG